MKNKYIQELDNIKADSSFKQAMIEKMENQTKPKFELSPLFMKVTLVCTCACLIFISIFTYKTYQETQALKQQLASATKQIEKLTDQLNQKDLDSFMQRNMDKSKDTYPIYIDPYMLGGMGGGDIFIGETMSNFELLKSNLPIDLKILKKYDKLPVLLPNENKFSLKSKKEILNNLINYYQVDSYNTNIYENYISIVSTDAIFEIYDSQLKISVANQNYDFNNLDSMKSYVDNILSINNIYNKDNYKIEFDYQNEGKELFVKIIEIHEDKLMNYLIDNYEYMTLMIFDDVRLTTTINLERYNIKNNETYPIISYSKALNMLEKDQYYSFGDVRDYLDKNNILYVGLKYMHSHDEYSLPFYSFFIKAKNLDLAKERGFIIEEDEYFICVLVPAISSSNIQYKNDFQLDLGQ